MAYKTIRCPNCGAALNAIPGRNSFFCQYCGSEIVREKPAPIEINSNVTVSGMASADSLLERAYIFLGDGDFDRANEYFERALDAEPKCSKAYFGKMLANLKYNSVHEFINNYGGEIEEDKNFKKALRFANEEEYEKLRSVKQENISTYNKKISTLQENLNSANARLSSFYEIYDDYYLKRKKEQNLLNAGIVFILLFAVFDLLFLLVNVKYALTLLVADAVPAIPLIICGVQFKKKGNLGLKMEEEADRLEKNVNRLKSDLEEATYKA